MTRWTRTIKVKDALNDDVSADGIKTAASTIIDRLAGTDAPCSTIEKAKDMAGSDPAVALLVFNDGMDRLYDWADDSRVWLS